MPTIYVIVLIHASSRYGQGKYPSEDPALLPVHTLAKNKEHVNANVRVQDQAHGVFSASTNTSAAGGTSQPHTKRAADTREPKPLSKDRDD